MYKDQCSCRSVSSISSPLRFFSRNKGQIFFSYLTRINLGLYILYSFFSQAVISRGENI